MPKIKIYHSDAIDLLKSLASESVDAIIQDPPFASKSPHLIEHQFFKEVTDNSKLDYNFWKEFTKEAYRVLKNDGWLATTMDIYLLGDFLFSAKNNKFYLRRILIWYTSYLIISKNLEIGYFTVPILSKKEKTKMNFERIKKYFGGELPGSVWVIPKRNENYRVTGAISIEPFFPLIELLTDEGDLVVDPFCGSATIGEACIILNRNYIGGDISKKMLEKAKIRLGGYLNGEDIFTSEP